MALHLSIKDGIWTDPTVWSTGIVPQLTGDTVEIHHRVLYDLNPAVADAMSFAWIKIIGSAQQAELYAYDGSLGTPVNYVLRVTGSPDDAGIQVIYINGMLTPKLTINNNTPGNAGRNCIFDLKHVGNTGDIFMRIDSRCNVQLQGIDIPDNAEVYTVGSSSIRVLGAMTGKWMIGDTLYYYRGNHYGVRDIYSVIITDVAAGAVLPGGEVTTVITASFPLIPMGEEGGGASILPTPGNTVVVMAKSVRVSNIVTGQCGKINVSTDSSNGLSLFR
jgi:hypothetical protein